MIFRIFQGFKYCLFWFYSIPAVCADLILREANGFDKIGKFLIFERGQAEVFPDYINHLFVFRAFGTDVFGEVLRLAAFDLGDGTACRKIIDRL